MGRMYVASFKGVAVTAAQDLFEIAAPSTMALIIHGWLVNQTTEVGDAQEEMLRLTTNRGEGTVTSGSGGSSVTARPLARGDAAASATVEANNTTIMAVGTGTLIELEVHNWNERVPYQFWYTPETRPVVRPSDRWTLELETAPADSVTMSGTIWFEEVG